MFAAGATCVGDVMYRDESLAPAAQEGLAGTFFREILGMSGDEVAPALTESGLLDATSSGAMPEPACGHPPRIRLGLSAHAPYSTGPDAIRATADIARESDMPLMMHVAESPAEDALVRLGEGRLVSLAARLAPDFEPPGTGTVAYLDSLGVLDDLIAVHAVHVDETDIGLLARKARGVVLCPRSNLFLDCGSPPVRALVDAGVPLALGTDSIASNRDFDLFEEARALREIDPSLPAARLLEIMTSEGARLLGLAGHGRLAPEGPADLTVVSLGSTEDPVRDVIGAARRKDIAAVMSAGVWRYRRERT
jgi:cytosine/adenosine deaminase-related metal-dependent hydrolase